jgi:small subunit ribosomal protein S8
MTDPIADMLTRIRNAQAVRKSSVLVPYSKLKNSLANILVKEGYLLAAEKVGNQTKPNIQLTLKYINKESVMKKLKRISTPGRRVYLKNKELPHVLNDLGVAIVSTSQGLMTNKEARQKKLGGEIICEIY